MLKLKTILLWCLFFIAAGLIIYFVICSTSDGYNNNDVKDVFNDIYSRKEWGKGTPSGTGSEIKNSLPYIEMLTKFVKDNHITSITDLGCGDFNIMSNISFIHDVDYYGIDASSNMINRNKNLFSHMTNVHFQQGDISSATLPITDLVIIKDVLQHLPNDFVIRTLNNINKYKYVIIVNCFRDKNNKQPMLNTNIDIGGFRYLDIREQPFNFKCNSTMNYDTKLVCIKQ